MTSHEHLTTPLPLREELEAELQEIERLIFLNEANENMIERTRTQEELEELQDYLLNEINHL